MRAGPQFTRSLLLGTNPFLFTGKWRASPNNMENFKPSLTGIPPEPSFQAAVSIIITFFDISWGPPCVLTEQSLGVISKTSVRWSASAGIGIPVLRCLRWPSGWHEWMKTSCKKMVITDIQLWAQQVPGSLDSCWDQKGRLPFRSSGSLPGSPSSRFWFSRKIQKQVFIQNVPILKYC